MTQTAPTVGVTLASGRRAGLEEWAWRLAPVWTGLGALALNVFLLGRQSLQFGEVEKIDAATGSWGRLWDAVVGREAPHALVDVLLKGWLALASTDAWTLRLPAAVAGAAAVGLTCALGTRLLERVAGLVAAATMATGVLIVEWSQRGHGATLALAAVVGATLVFVAALEEPSRRRWVLWALLAGVAMAASLLMAPVLVAQGAAFAARRPRPDWRPPAVALAVVTIVALASAALVLASDAGRIDHLAVPGLNQVAEGLWRLGGLTPVPVAVAALGLFALVTARVEGASTWKAVLLGTWLLAPVLTGLLLSLGRPTFDAGYAIASSPALALLVAAGVVSQTRWIALALVALLAGGAGFRLVEWYSGPSREDWRAAVETIRSEQRAGEAVLVLPQRQSLAAAYYAGDGFTIDRPRGHRVWLLLAVGDADRRLTLARKRLHPPRYALLEERRFGDGLWLQVWAEP